MAAGGPAAQHVVLEKSPEEDSIDDRHDDARGRQQDEVCDSDPVPPFVEPVSYRYECPEAEYNECDEVDVAVGPVQPVSVLHTAHL